MGAREVKPRPRDFGSGFCAYGIYCYLGFLLRLRVYLHISCCEVSDLKYAFVKKLRGVAIVKLGFQINVL